jgi:hypothetical protein
MGAWGRGLLQNDSAQDGLLEISDGIEADILRLLGRRSEAVVGRLAAGVGLLLQLRIWHCFDPEHDFLPRLLDILEHHEPKFTVLPKTAIDLLGAIREGKGLELVSLDGQLPDDLAQAFFDSKPGFPMERPTGMRHPGMFEHPASAAYVQKVADRCVKRVSSGFRRSYEVSDLSREGGETISALCILLQLEPCQVPPENFRDWWDRYRAATASSDSEEDESERTFEIAYRRGLRLALDHGLRRFSGKKKVVPLAE